MLFSTSLVALTLSPRVLRIQNTKVIRTTVAVTAHSTDWQTEALDYLRDDFSHSHTCDATEQETTGGGAGVRALYLRHQQHADAEE